jgi:hypothetical protein
MTQPRRQFLKTTAALAAAPGAGGALLGLAVAPFLPGAAPATAAETPNTGGGLAPEFPAHTPALAREMVGVSHGNLARVQELLAEHPTLAGASWDWGFGDWETALGAASHVGSREIAALLIEHGARPDLFTFAMLGQLDVVKSYLAANPGLQRLKGPHGLTLMHHAKRGGEVALGVVAHLEQLGDADIGTASQPLPAGAPEMYVGAYAVGASGADRFEVSTNQNGALGLKRLPDGAFRNLFHLGDHAFHPPGNDRVRIVFTVANGRATSLVIMEGTRQVEALRADL